MYIDIKTYAQIHLRLAEKNPEINCINKKNNSKHDKNQLFNPKIIL